MAKHAGNQRSYFGFALWAQSLGRIPTVKEIEGFFQVSRQSAWRIQKNWLYALTDHRESTSRRQPATNPLRGPIK